MTLPHWAEKRALGGHPWRRLDHALAALAAPPTSPLDVLAGAPPPADGHGFPALSPPAPAYSGGNVVISVVAERATSPRRSTRARRGGARARVGGDRAA